MNNRIRYPADDNLRSLLPNQPGVYAWYRNNAAVYIGKAKNLHYRVWKCHMGKSRTLGNSSFRRNVAEQLGIATTQDIKTKKVRLNETQLKVVRRWIIECEVTWIKCKCETDAIQLEAELKKEWMPFLTKQ